MKTLHLLRHAKSAWNQPRLSDRERGLKRRGRLDASRIGSALAQRMEPMPIYTSPARRARLTLRGMCAGWPALESQAHSVEEDLRRWLSRQDDSAHSLFIISHNPALTELVNELVGDHCLDNLPTAGYVELRLPIERWRDLSPGGAVLQYSLFPKVLRGNS